MVKLLLALSMVILPLSTTVPPAASAVSSSSGVFTPSSIVTTGSPFSFGSTHSPSWPSASVQPSVFVHTAGASDSPPSSGSTHAPSWPSASVQPSVFVHAAGASGSPPSSGNTHSPSCPLDNVQPSVTVHWGSPSLAASTVAGSRDVTMHKASAIAMIFFFILLLPFLIFLPLRHQYRKASFSSIQNHSRLSSGSCNIMHIMLFSFVVRSL